MNTEAIRSDYSLEDEVFNNVSFAKLREEVNNLPEIQRRRIKKYYFEDKTYEEIAAEEGCSKVAIKYSIDIALKKIKKNLLK